MILNATMRWYQQQRSAMYNVDQNSNSNSDFELTIDSPYLALPGEPWGVYC